MTNDTRPTEAEARVRFWAQRRASEPREPVVMSRDTHRCEACGALLVVTRFDSEPRPCPRHPDAGRITWTRELVRAWRYVREEPVLTDPDRDGWDERLWVGAERGDLALAMVLRERWGELPELRMPEAAAKATNRGMFR